MADTEIQDHTNIREWGNAETWMDATWSGDVVDLYLNEILNRHTAPSEDPEYDEVCDTMCSAYASAVDDVIAPYREAAGARLAAVTAEWNRKEDEDDYDDEKYNDAYSWVGAEHHEYPLIEATPGYWREPHTATEMRRLEAQADEEGEATTLDGGDEYEINWALKDLDIIAVMDYVIGEHVDFFRRHGDFDMAEFEARHVEDEAAAAAAAE